MTGRIGKDTAIIQKSREEILVIYITGSGDQEKQTELKFQNFTGFGNCLSVRVKEKIAKMIVNQMYRGDIHKIVKVRAEGCLRESHEMTFGQEEPKVSKTSQEEGAQQPAIEWLWDSGTRSRLKILECLIYQQ